MSIWAIPKALQAEVTRVLGFPDVLSSSSIEAHYPNYASELAIYQPYAQLLAKLTFLSGSPEEAVPIFGQQHPQFGTFYVPATFTIPLASPSAPTTGAKVTVSVNGTSISATAAAGNQVIDVANGLATALNANAAIAAIVIAQASAVDAQHADVVLYATAAGTLGNGVAVIATATDPSLTVATIGPVLAGATSGGQDPPGPTMPAPKGAAQPTIYGYLPIILQLENDLGGGRKFLTYATADVVTFRPDELGQRGALLNRFRRELADRLSVPLDPDIAGNRRRMVGARRVV